MKNNKNILKNLCETLRNFAKLCVIAYAQSNSKIINQKFAIILLLFSAFSFSQSITSSIDSTEIKIGSQFNLTIKANVKSTDRVSFPEGQMFGALEVLESYPVDTIKSDNKFELIKKYGLTQFDSGRFVVPPLSVILNEKAVKTDSFPIQVNNVVVDTTKQQMYDIKDVVKVEKPANYSWLWVLLIVLGAALLGFGLYYLIKRKQNVKNEKEALLFASPIEKALAQLQNLEKKELWQNGETKAYYSELTDITRTYIEEAVDVPAMESTSTELYDALIVAVRNKKIKLSKETLEQFKKVMQNADLVKFAKSKPLDFEIENDKSVINNFLISLDKAIPRTEEETENLFAEELKRKKEKKQKLQRILIPITAVVMLLGIVGVFFLVTKGTEYVRDHFIGHNSKSLLESEWITSDYGDPAITISTPKVLVRDANKSNKLLKINKFYFADSSSYISTSVTIVKLEKSEVEIPISLDALVEESLNKLSTELHAQNIFPDESEFKLEEENLEGKKITGTFTINSNSENKKFYFSDIILKQDQIGIYKILIIIPDKDEYAKEIMDKIITSIELKKAVPNE